MFDINKYLRDTNQTFSSDNPGWINLSCPICKSTIYGSNPNKGYLGFNLSEGYFNCWRCGGHSVESFIMAVESLPYEEACKRARQYETDFSPVIHSPKPPPPTVIQLPLGTKAMTERHKSYLKKRNYDPDLLAYKYNLLGTGPAGDCPHRIVIPIYYEGRLLSWQARDITNKSDKKYKFPFNDRSKNILYNLDNCQRLVCLIVEGPSDVWRLGDDTCATFGTSFTYQQVMLLVNRFKKTFLIYDSEPKAIKHARKLNNMLIGLGTESEVVILDKGDPGDMNQNEVNSLRQELLGE